MENVEKNGKCGKKWKMWEKVENVEKNGKCGKKWKMWKKMARPSRTSPDTAGAVKNISDNPLYYIRPKELQKELQKELRLGAALSPYSELHCRCRSCALPLSSYKI